MSMLYKIYYCYKHYKITELLIVKTENSFIKIRLISSQKELEKCVF